MHAIHLFMNYGKALPAKLPQRLNNSMQHSEGWRSVIVVYCRIVWILYVPVGTVGGGSGADWSA